MGASVIRDPRYQALAATAAGGLGAGPNVQRAILAQFACEKAGEWPPNDNNPGNVHVGPMAQVGQVLPRGRGDSGQVALFPTPDAGAWGYAAYIGRHPLYVDARRDIARDDGEAYIRDVLKRGYGTNASCTLGYYRALGGTSSTPLPAGGLPGFPGDPGLTPRPTTGGGSAPLPKGTTDQWNAAIACFLGKHPSYSGGRVPIGLKAADLPDLVTCANQNGIAIMLADVQPYQGQTLSAVRDALAALGTIPPANPGAIVPDVVGAINTAIGAAIGGIVPIVVGGLVLVVAAALILGGGRDTLSGAAG